MSVGVSGKILNAEAARLRRAVRGVGHWLPQSGGGCFLRRAGLASASHSAAHGLLRRARASAPRMGIAGRTAGGV